VCAIAFVPHAEAADHSNVKVIALLSGVITDNGWNQICYESVKNLENKYGVACEYIESIAVSDMPEYLRMCGEDGYDMVIIHGSQFEAAAADIADRYPNIKFCLSYGFRVAESGSTKIVEKPNLAYVGPVNMGVIIGAIMGILTNNNKVVFLGGQDIPAITDVVSGVEEGVRLTNKEADVVTDYLGTLTDADRAKEITLTYINAGFDVISSSANSAQLGCLYAAEEKGVYALGFNGDQYDIAPGAVVLSVMRNYPSIYEDVFLSVVNGNWQSGMVIYDLKHSGTLVSDWHGWDTKLPANKVSAINETLKKLYAGELGDY
jgi:basic membrane protein A